MCSLISNCGGGILVCGTGCGSFVVECLRTVVSGTSVPMKILSGLVVKRMGEGLPDDGIVIAEVRCAMYDGDQKRDQRKNMKRAGFGSE